MPLPTLEDKREVVPIYARISIHQIRGRDLGTAAPATNVPKIGLALTHPKVLQFVSSPPSG